METFFLTRSHHIIAFVKKKQTTGKDAEREGSSTQTKNKKKTLKKNQRAALERNREGSHLSIQFCVFVLLLLLLFGTLKRKNTACLYESPTEKYFTGISRVFIATRERVRSEKERIENLNVF